jgi:hypothetical protein
VGVEGLVVGRPLEVEDTLVLGLGETLELPLAWLLALGLWEVLGEAV